MQSAKLFDTSSLLFKQTRSSWYACLSGCMTDVKAQTHRCLLVEISVHSKRQRSGFGSQFSQSREWSIRWKPGSGRREIAVVFVRAPRRVRDRRLAHWRRALGASGSLNLPSLNLIFVSGQNFWVVSRWNLSSMGGLNFLAVLCLWPAAVTWLRNQPICAPVTLEPPWAWLLPNQRF